MIPSKKHFAVAALEIVNPSAVVPAPETNNTVEATLSRMAVFDKTADMAFNQS